MELSELLPLVVLTQNAVAGVRPLRRQRELVWCHACACFVDCHAHCGTGSNPESADPSLSRLASHASGYVHTSKANPTSFLVFLVWAKTKSCLGCCTTYRMPMAVKIEALKSSLLGGLARPCCITSDALVAPPSYLYFPLHCTCNTPFPMATTTWDNKVVYQRLTSTCYASDFVYIITTLQSTLQSPERTRQDCGHRNSQVLSGETRFLRIRAYPEKIGAEAPEQPQNSRQSQKRQNRDRTVSGGYG